MAGVTTGRSGRPVVGALLALVLLATTAAAGRVTDAPPPPGPVAVDRAAVDAAAGTVTAAARAGQDPPVAAAPEPRPVELPGGGRTLFPGHRLVALYGHPGSPALGVLGEQGVAESVRRAGDLAAQYQALAPETAVPTFEIIATVADVKPGRDGDYSAESRPEDLRPWVDAARDAGGYVLLDLQPGRADFLAQARRYADLLAEPHVGLALDPEWRLRPDQRHRKQIGSVDVDEVNRVVGWLADLTRDRGLPQKVLMLHQFRAEMIRGRDHLDLARPELAVVLHADGFGTTSVKDGTWDRLHQGAPAGLWWGWKNFIDEDRPMLTPEQTVRIGPTSPVVVTYQ
jgi:hypothetical protein